MTGRIKTLHPTYGFIVSTTDGERQELFFHQTDCADFDQLRVGDQVSFERVTPSPPKGDRARDVSRTTAPATVSSALGDAPEEQEG